MTSIRDRAVTVALVAVLAVSAGVLAQPAGNLPVIGGASPEPSASTAPTRPYREGIVGLPQSITPVTAHSRVERTLVGLIFSGLIKLGPGSTLLPDLAESWTQDETGTIWTFKIRGDAAWQDGQTVTAADVVYTVGALKDPASSGAMAASWAEVTAAAIDAKTVRFTLATPITGFLAALTQPLLPAHLLGDVPLADLATSDFALHPVGSGPFSLVLVDDSHAVLHLVDATRGPGGPSPSASPVATSTPSPTPTESPTPAPTESPTPAPTPSSSASTSRSPAPRVSAGPSAGALTPAPTLAPTPVALVTPTPASMPFNEIQVFFFATDADLEAAFRAGKIDAADGLTGAAAKDLLALPGTDDTRYPTTVLTAVMLNLRATHPELRNAEVRKALLGAINRSAMVSSVLDGAGVVADTLLPPGSWAYDAQAAGSVPFDQGSSAKALTKLGWTKIGNLWAAPKTKTAYKIEILTVPVEANRRIAMIGTAVTEAWRQLGFDVVVTRLDAPALTARLRSGDFTAAVLDISLGLEPDLYPLLASTQVRTTGSNVAGYQDPELDTLLEAARAPGSAEARDAAWRALLKGLAARMPILPIAWAQEIVVSRGVSGATPRLIARPGDRYWDVLAWRLAADR
jgi:ABC-type transport system substrate-binding protein